MAFECWEYSRKYLKETFRFDCKEGWHECLLVLSESLFFPSTSQLSCYIIVLHLVLHSITFIIYSITFSNILHSITFNTLHVLFSNT